MSTKNVPFSAARLKHILPLCGTAIKQTIYELHVLLVHYLLFTDLSFPNLKWKKGTKGICWAKQLPIIKESVLFSTLPLCIDCTLELLELYSLLTTWLTLLSETITPTSASLSLLSLSHHSLSIYLPSLSPTFSLPALRPSHCFCLSLFIYNLSLYLCTCICVRVCVCVGVCVCVCLRRVCVHSYKKVILDTKAFFFTNWWVFYENIHIEWLQDLITNAMVCRPSIATLLVWMLALECVQNDWILLNMFTMYTTCNITCIWKCKWFCVAVVGHTAATLTLQKWTVEKKTVAKMEDINRICWKFWQMIAKTRFIQYICRNLNIFRLFVFPHTVHAFDIRQSCLVDQLQAHKCRCKHTHSHRHTHTHIHTHTHTHKTPLTPTKKHAPPQTHKETQRQSHQHKHTHTHKGTQTTLFHVFSSARP